MIQINELRIGNLIQEGKVEQIDNSIDEIYYSGDGYYLCNYCCNLNAIPLTEEWLLKLGFVKDGIWFNYSFGFYSLGISKDPSGFNFSYDDGFIPVKYVHELQNLIFSLSGSDLQLVV